MRTIHLARAHPRVFLGFLDVCGYYSALCSGLRENGCIAFFLNLHWLPDARPPYQKGWLIPNMYLWVTDKFRRTRKLGKWNPFRYLVTLLQLIALMILIAWMLIYFDVLVLKSGESFFLNHWDLWLFRIFGKKIVYTFHGSDSRPPYLNGAGTVGMSADSLLLWTQKTKRLVDAASGFADYIIDNPLSAHFQTRRCVKYQAIGNPIGPEKIKEIQATRLAERGREVDSGRAVRILHAPTYPLLKGSAEIKRLIQKLSNSYNIEYVEITDRPVSEVLEKLLWCDFLIDELYSDMHGAMLSIEACAFQRPSIVCGYASSELDRFVPSEFRVPTKYQDPSFLENVMVEFIQNAEARRETGRQAREFFENHAYAASVASRFLQLLEGSAPESWFFDPADTRYVFGVGGPKDRVRDALRKLVLKHGPAALQLDDKPELKEMILEFAGYDMGSAH